MKEVDIVLPLGVACRPAEYLVEIGLRKKAYPLDWQMDYTLDTVLHLFQTQFKDFFVVIEERGIAPSKKHRRIRDTLNGIESIHHFSLELSVEEGQNRLWDRTRQQYKHLDDRLRHVNSLLLICNRRLPFEEVQAFLKSFACLYPNLTIEMINIRNVAEMPSTTYECHTARIGPNLTAYEYMLNDTMDTVSGEEFDWKGNPEMWKQILEQYTLKETDT